ncbi:glycosyltransferase, partial [Acinetobacter baumannii]
MYFGRLAPEKGVATLINAAVKAKVPLKIVGTGPLETQLKSQAAENAQQIEFLGYKTGQDLIDLIQNSRCVVLPSEWYENAP